jgi:hypothetical protein
VIKWKLIGEEKANGKREAVGRPSSSELVVSFYSFAIE